MVLRLQYLKYQIRGSHLLPYFLSYPQDQALPQRLIDHFEKNVEKTRKSIDFDKPLTWAPDNRIVRALIATLFNRFYTFTPSQIEDLLDEAQLMELQQQGIASLEEFRIWFWEYVQNKYGGFIPREKRTEGIKKIATTLNLNLRTLEQLLTAHREEHMFLHRNDNSPTPENLIGAYNYEVLETLLYNCDSVTLIISGDSLGSTARSLLKYTKRYGVLVDLEATNETLRATIGGPRIFFGRASSFGWNIAQVISNLLQEAPSLRIHVNSISLDVILRNRHYKVQLNSETLPLFLPRGPVREEESFLDSKVEEQFYWSWYNHKFRGWDIIREPKAFVFGSHLIIPDFALIKDDHQVLIEIIGYWREEYTQKKRAQLELLKQSGLKHMILLVDSKHRRYFVKSIYPVVFYFIRGKRYEIPYGKILKELPP